MSERGNRLLATADGQISKLIQLLSTPDDAVLSRRCPGREKLGDGTVAACAEHTANNYFQIAEFLRGHRGNAHDPPPSHEGHSHGGQESVGREGLLDQLARGRTALGILAELTDKQLDRVPPAGEMKFCDGQRTLEQVVTSLLKHQGHQIDALTAPVA